MSILLCSESPVKINVVSKFFPSYDIETINCGACGIPEQPVSNYETNGLIYPKERINFARNVLGREKWDTFDYVISIENVIDIPFEVDHAFVLIYSRGVFGNGKSVPCKVPEGYISKLTSHYMVSLDDGQLIGYATTIGDLLHADNLEIDPKNWTLVTEIFDRTQQIMDAFEKAQSTLKDRKSLHRELSDSFALYPDFPKPGVLFADMFPLFSNSNKLHQLVQSIVQVYSFDRLTHIVGLEARGFCLGTVIAYAMNIGFVPIRKAGKLPGETLMVSYGKEYGTDVCEIAQTAIPPGSRVLIIDDLIATGGSMRAACNLVSNSLGFQKSEDSKIIDCCVLKSVPSLKKVCDETMHPFQYTVLFQ